MSINSRLVLMIHNDSSIYRLLLIGLLVASPALHYLCYNNTFDPPYLRSLSSVLCLLTLGVSFFKNKIYYQLGIYVTTASFIVVNNGLLLSANNFEHIYVFSAIIVFMGVSFLCKKRREFAATTLFNIITVTIAWFTASAPQISIIPFILLLSAFTVIAYITVIVRKVYRLKFKKALHNLTNLNRTLVLNQQKLRESRNQLHALINSINDIIFEVDENKTCLNVWYNELVPLHFNPRALVNKPLQDIIGLEKARPFGEAIDQVIANRKPISMEFASVFGTDKWYMAKMTPVFDREGNYTSRISISITDISDRKKYENALKQNEALLLEAHAIAKLGNWWFDGNTRESYLSGNLYTILEIDNLDIGADKFGVYMSLVHPDDHESTVKYFAEITTLSPSTFEHKIITHNGNLKYIKVIRGDVVYDEQGNFKRISGVIQDITGIRLSEKSARVSRAELIEAQTIAKIGNWKWEVTLGLLSWSDEINNIYEFNGGNHSAHNFIRMFLKHVHPDDKYIFKKLVKSPASVTNTSYEYRIITPAGKIKHLSAIVDKLLTRDGSLRKIIGTVQDITERKKSRN
jgi:two-component system sensor histidine kinase/response regulator